MRMGTSIGVVSVSAPHRKDGSSQITCRIATKSPRRTSSGASGFASVDDGALRVRFGAGDRVEVMPRKTHDPTKGSPCYREVVDRL